MGFGLRLDHVSLRVRDLDASVAFYSTVLGLPEIENKTGKSHIRWFALGPEHSLHLIGGAQEIPDDRPLSTHVALATANFESAVQRLLATQTPFNDSAGHNGQPAIRPDGVRQIYFQDPDRHWVEINDAG